VGVALTVRGALTYVAAVRARIRYTIAHAGQLRYRRGRGMIDILVNGQSRRLADSATVAALLEQMQLAGKRLAVERNGEIVPKSRHAETGLGSGDRVEIVVAVGGG
jgi:sulfur carrier protein